MPARERRRGPQNRRRLGPVDDTAAGANAQAMMVAEKAAQMLLQDARG